MRFVLAMVFVYKSIFISVFAFAFLLLTIWFASADPFVPLGSPRLRWSPPLLSPFLLCHTSSLSSLPVFACICLYVQSRSTVIQHQLVQIVSLMAWELEFNLFLFGPRKKFPQLGFGVRPIISTRPYNHQDQKLFLAYYFIFLHISFFFHISCTSSIFINHTKSSWKRSPPAPCFCLSFWFAFLTQNTCQAWLSTVSLVVVVPGFPCQVHIGWWSLSLNPLNNPGVRFAKIFCKDDIFPEKGGKGQGNSAGFSIFCLWEGFSQFSCPRSCKCTFWNSPHVCIFSNGAR